MSPRITEMTRTCVKSPKNNCHVLFRKCCTFRFDPLRRRVCLILCSDIGKGAGLNNADFDISLDTETQQQFDAVYSQWKSKSSSESIHEQNDRSLRLFQPISPLTKFQRISRTSSKPSCHPVKALSTSHSSSTPTPTNSRRRARYRWLPLKHFNDARLN